MYIAWLTVANSTFMCVSRKFCQKGSTQLLHLINGLSLAWGWCPNCFNDKDKDIEALFNVAYNVTDNISSQANFCDIKISLTDTYLPVLLYLPSTTPFMQASARELLVPFFMPPPFIMGGHIASPLSVRTYVRPVRPVPYVRKMVSGRYLLKTLVYWIHISYTGI